jgi:CheY-like chemotaxis protein
MNMKGRYPDSQLPALAIVDDCDDDIFLLRHRLREGGITNPIHAFSSPPQALAYLRAIRNRGELPSILFTDIRMPVGCGFALIAAVRANPNWDQVRIAVVSASNDMVDVERALDHGANGYLLKFPPADSLAEFVRNGPWIHSSGVSGARRYVGVGSEPRMRAMPALANGTR